MIPAPFDYAAPTSLNEVFSLLSQNPDAKVLAGGHSLLPVIKLRLSSPSLLVDINRVPGLRGTQPRPDGGFVIGAMTTYHEIAVEFQSANALGEACRMIGDLQVRNRGTIGGNLAHNDPASDLTAVALALEAEIHIAGPRGERQVPAQSFFKGLFETALAPDEIVTAVSIPATQPTPPAWGGSVYEKFENPASGYALCGVAAKLVLGADGMVQKCRVALTGAAEYATRLYPVEEALEGQKLSEGSIMLAAQRAGQGLSFNADIHASADYRAHLTRVLTKRALTRLLQRIPS